MVAGLFRLPKKRGIMLLGGLEKATWRSGRPLSETSEGGNGLFTQTERPFSWRSGEDIGAQRYLRKGCR